MATSSAIGGMQLDEPWKNMCRSCVEGKDNLVPIFAKDTSKMCLANLYAVCVDLEISKQDGLPDQICQNCVFKLHLLYQFRTQCKKSHIFFKKHLPALKESGVLTRSEDDPFTTNPTTNSTRNSTMNPITNVEKEVKIEFQAINPIALMDEMPNVDFQWETAKMDEASDDELPLSYIAEQQAKLLKSSSSESKINVNNFSEQKDNPTSTKIVHYDTISKSNEFEELLSMMDPSDLSFCLNETDDRLTKRMMWDENITATAVGDFKNCMMVNQNVNIVSIPNTSSATVDIKNAVVNPCENISLPNTSSAIVDAKNYTMLNRNDNMISIPSTSSAENKKNKPSKKSHLLEEDAARIKKNKKALKKQNKQLNIEAPTTITVPKEKIACNICCQDFPTKDELKTHKTLHQFYVCKNCQLRFKTIQEVRMHTCQNEQPEGSGLQNEAEVNLDNQRRRENTPQWNRLFKCLICEREFKYTRTLQYHIRSHTGEKPSLCAWCGKDFREPRGLINHVRAVHTGEKRFKCSYCPKAFPVSGKRRQHERVHTGERPYQCDICSRMFTARTTLTAHHRRHTKEIKFVCKIPNCDKGFYAFSTYQRHVWCHRGEKPYTCSHCDKAYLSNQNLISHVKAAHAKLRDEVCHVCGKGFVVKSVLNRHLRKIHTIEPKDSKPEPVFATPVTTAPSQKSD